MGDAAMMPPDRWGEELGVTRESANARNGEWANGQRRSEARSAEKILA